MITAQTTSLAMILPLLTHRLAIIEDQRSLEAELAAKEAEEQRLRDEERRRYDEVSRDRDTNVMIVCGNAEFMTR